MHSGRSLCPKSSEMDRKTVEPCSLVRWVHISACFWEKRTSDSTCHRWKRPSRLFPTKSAKTTLCDGMGVHQYPWHWMICIWIGTIDGEAYVGLFPGTPCLFQQDSGRPHSAQDTTEWLCRHTMCVCLTSLPAVQIGLLLKIYHEEENQTTCPRAVEQKFCMHQEREKIHLQNCNNWYLQFPNNYKV